MTTPVVNELALPTAIEEFVQRIQTADWDGMEDHLTVDVLYDASVPGWHYQYAGASRVLQEYREEWSGRYRWTIVEQHVVAADDAFVLAMEAQGSPIRDGLGPVVIRLANLFRLESDRIAEHRFFCCGEWDVETVRHIDEHAPKVEGRQA